MNLNLSFFSPPGWTNLLGRLPGWAKLLSWFFQLGVTLVVALALHAPLEGWIFYAPLGGAFLYGVLFTRGGHPG